MTAVVRILTTASVDSAPSILLVSPDGSKILVNCGEGSQRTFIEYSQKLSTVKAVCLTHLGHQALGGLPGAILTMADVAGVGEKTGDPEKSRPAGGLDLIGPVGTQAFVQSLRHFMTRNNFPLQVHEGAIKNLAISKKKTKKSADQTEFAIDSLVFSSVQEQCTSNGSRKRPRLDDDCRRNFVSYIFKTPPIPGKFLPTKAAALGVPKGPLYGKLKGGDTVTFTDSKGQQCTVESAQVVESSSPAVAFMVLYYPSEQVAQQLFACERIRTDVESEDVFMELIIHLTNSDLFERYGVSHWKERHGNCSAEHIFLSKDPIDSTPFRSAAIGAKARALLCPQVYRVPWQEPTSQSEDGFRVGRRLMEYVLIPRAKRGFREVADESPRQEAEALVEQTGALSLSKQILGNMRLAENGTCSGELIFTGTASAMPCKYRNVTGMLLRQSDGRAILLDVGEGTIGQLLRMEQDFVLEDIKAVWISHPHADHHLGILRLLGERNATEPLQLLAPEPIFRFLEEFAELVPSIRGTYYAIDCKYLMRENKELRDRLAHFTGISDCRTVPVAHCPHAYAVILDGTCFGRVVYSGDCRPSKQLAQVARGADLLIHEATFEDGMEAEAVLRKHSTVGEALIVANEMEAKCTVLTHFSQRYPKVPPLHGDTQATSPVIFAFDFMRLQQHTLDAASKLTPALRLLYPEDKDEEEDEENDVSAAQAVLSEPGTFARSDLL